MWNCIIEGKNGKMISLKMVIGLLADIETKLELAYFNGDKSIAKFLQIKQNKSDLNFGV